MKEEEIEDIEEVKKKNLLILIIINSSSSTGSFIGGTYFILYLVLHFDFTTQ